MCNLCTCNLWMITKYRIIFLRLKRQYLMQLLNLPRWGAKYIFCNENKNWRMNSVMAGNSSWIRDGSHFTPWLNRSSVPDTLAFQDCQDKKMCGYILWNCKINSCLLCFRNAITLQQKPSIMTSFVTLVLSTLIQLSHSGEKPLGAFA